jgi:hypothetical protein
MDNTKWMQSYLRKTSFFCTYALESCVAAHENTYYQVKIMIFASFFIFDSTVSKKMDHFDILFACSFFSKSWEVTNYGFLDVAHLPLIHLASDFYLFRVEKSVVHMLGLRQYLDIGEETPRLTRCYVDGHI